MPGIQLPIGIETVNPVDADYKRGPWPTIAAALAGINIALRYNNLTFYVVGDPNEYYWLDTDLTNAGLLIRSSSGGASLPIVHQVYLVEDVSDAILMGGVASHVYITAQAAYTAADILTAGGTIPVVIKVGKTTAVVGDIVLTSNSNPAISFVGLSTDDSQIGSIIGTNALGDAYNLNGFLSNITVQSIDLRATGVTGNSGNISIGGYNLNILGNIDTSCVNATGAGGSIQYASTAAGGGFIVQGNITTSAGSTTSYAGDLYIFLSAVNISGVITLANNNDGGSIYIIGASSSIINGGISTIASTVASTNSYTIYNTLFNAPCTIISRGGGSLDIENCDCSVMNLGSVGVGALNVSTNATFFADITCSGLVKFTAEKCAFTTINNPATLSSFVGCVISIAMTSVATITVDVTETSLPSTSVSATIKLTNYNSIIPIVRYVYLVQDSADKARMGDRHNNVYTTFQAAYDAANALQVALGGSNIVVIQVGNITAAVSGNLTLTANYNRFVQINGISLYNSILGNIVGTNAAGNGFTIGTNAGIFCVFTNVQIGSISTNATGTTGTSGTISLRLSNVQIGAIDTSITNAANTTGSGGNFISSANTNIATLGNITTSSKATTTNAGTVTISAANMAIGIITTAQNNLLGTIGISSPLGRININSISMNSLSVSNVNLLAVTVSSNSSITTNGAITFTNCTFSGGAQISTTSITAIVLTVINTIFSNTLTTQDLIQTLATGCSLSRIITMGSNSKLANTTFDGSVTPASPVINGIGSGCSFYNCAVLSGSFAIDNPTPVSVLFTSKFSSYQNIPNVNVTLT